MELNYQIAPVAGRDIWYKLKSEERFTLGIWPMQRTLVGIVALAFLTGCSVGADTKDVEAAIPVFHRQLDAGQFDRIYADASDELKRGTTQSDMVQLLSAVHRKLGVFRSGKGAEWNDNMTTNGHFVTEVYSAQYARGTATESFVYRVSGPRPLLAGYHINSTALILN